MNINLRGISQKLHDALKVKAVEEKVSLQSLCVRFLWWGLDTKPSALKSVLASREPVNAAQFDDAFSVETPQGPVLGSAVVTSVDSESSTIYLSAPESLEARKARALAAIGGVSMSKLFGSNVEAEYTDYTVAEVPICGFEWPEETAEGFFRFECLMDKGHKSSKHGQGGMVRKLEA